MSVAVVVDPCKEVPLAPLVVQPVAAQPTNPSMTSEEQNILDRFLRFSSPRFSRALVKSEYELLTIYK